MVILELIVCKIKSGFVLKQTEGGPQRSAEESDHDGIEGSRGSTGAKIRYYAADCLVTNRHCKTEPLRVSRCRDARLQADTA